MSGKALTNSTNRYKTSMRFQVTERINTNAQITDVGACMQSNFRRVAFSAVPVNHILRVTSIHASFGSINRRDVTDISILRAENGYLLVADVNYRPSGAFWIFLLLGLCTGLIWLLPVIFYILQKDTVKRAIEDCFRNVKNELSFGQAPEMPVTAQSSSAIADLEKLGSLLQQGLITQEEFNRQKRKLLGMPEPPTQAMVTPPPIPAQGIEANGPATEDEEQASRSFAHARKCVKNGQKEMAIDILKDIIKRFPNTKAAANAQKSLAPRTKP